jgi:hypothetical protein
MRLLMRASMLVCKDSAAVVEATVLLITQSTSEVLESQELGGSSKSTAHAASPDPRPVER